MRHGVRHPCMVRIAFFILCLLISGCSNKDTADKAPNTQDAPIAWVEGSPITQKDLDLFIERSLGVKQSRNIDQATRIKLIDSLVKSRAMALREEKIMSKAEMMELDRRVAAYREELLVNRYLYTHADLTPVTNEMIKEYYVRHMDEFGGGKIKSFEYVKSGPDPDEDARDRIISEMGRLRKVKDWHSEEKLLRGKGITYHKARISVDMLEKPLKSLVEKTVVNDVSEIFMGREIVMVRVLEEIEQPARPLNEVSESIRKKVAPAVMKNAIEQASADALAQASVTYGNKNDSPGVHEKE